MATKKKRKKWDREARRALDASVAAVGRAHPSKVANVLRAEIEELSPLVLARKLRKGDLKAELLDAASHATEDAEDEAWLLAEVKDALEAGLEGARLAKEPLAVAEALNAKFGPFAVWQERLYRCEDGKWTHITTRKATGLVYQLSRERKGFTASPHATKGVLEALSSHVAYEVAEQPPVWLEAPPTSSEVGQLALSHQNAPGASDVLPAALKAASPLLITGGPAWTVLAPNTCIDPVSKRTFRPHKSLFHPFPLAVEYDRNAADPVQWLAFLKGTGITRDETKMLQEYMGYCLTGATEMQKFLMIRGGPGTGKGTLATVCRAIYGEGYTSTTLEQLGTQFGLAKLSRKSVAVIGDAHLRQRGDQTSILDRFLSITGGDDLPVDQKFKDEVDALFTVRFIMLTNQLPRFHDASAAFARRSLAMEFNNAPLEPDPTLPARLVSEAPGILRWALNGLSRLVKQGHFTEGPRSKAIVQEMINLTSPVRPFLQDVCRTKGKVECTVLYERYKLWADENGYQPMNSSAFGRLLREAVPGVTKERPSARTKGGPRPYYYEGISMKRGGQ